MKNFIVIFDSDIFSAQQHGGISVYFKNLKSSLSHLKQSKFNSFSFLPFKFDSSPSLPRLIFSFVSPVLYWLRYKGRVIYHPTHTRNPFVFIFPGKVVITLHDLIPETFPFISNSLFKNKLVCLARLCYIYRASAIIVPSFSTQRDLLKIYPWASSKPISVVNHGCDHLEKKAPFLTDIARAMNVSTYKILYVGSRARYKGFDHLLRALNHIKSTGCFEFSLFCIGQPFEKSEIALIKSLGLSSSVYSFQVPFGSLGQYYAMVDCFVYPSIAEGFGFPLLEAMLNYCLVISSDIPSSLEVAKSHALYFESANSESLASTLRFAHGILDDELDLIHSKARTYAKSFKWSNSARDTLEVYDSLI